MGKSTGKTIVSIAGLFFGAFNPTAFGFSAGVNWWAGVMGASLFGNIWSATHKGSTPSVDTRANFDVLQNTANADECGASVDTRTYAVSDGSTSKVIVHPDDNTAENYWINGTITIGYESRQVKASTSTTITVDIPFFSSPITGATISYTNGCNKSYSDCKRHANTRNYSGFLAIPTTEYTVVT